MRTATLISLGLVVSALACEVHMGTDAKTASNPPATPATPATAAPATPATPATATPTTPTTPPSRHTRATIQLSNPTPAPTPTPTPSGGTPTINKSIDFGTPDAKPGSLTGTVYFIPENTAKFPDVSKLTPVAKLYTTELNIPARRFDAGFPGVNDRNEWFAIRYEGNLEVSTEADYEFRLVSDDGALFYIDNTLIIDNDGIHPPSEKRQAVHLTKATHSMRVDYFQGPRYDIALQLYVTPAGGLEKPAGTKL